MFELCVTFHLSLNILKPYVETFRNLFSNWFGLLHQDQSILCVARTDQLEDQTEPAGSVGSKGGSTPSDGTNQFEAGDFFQTWQFGQIGQFVDNL